MMSPSYSWICLIVLLSLLASSAPQFNSFSSRSRFQPTPRFGLNSFSRQRGLNSFGRGVFTTTLADNTVSQTIPISTLAPDIEKVASITSPSTRRSSTTVKPVTPSSSVFGPQSSSSTGPVEAPRSLEPTRSVFTNLLGRLNILTTKEPVDIRTVEATTTEAASSPSSPVKFSNLFGRHLASSEHLLPYTTTRPTVQPLKLVTTVKVAGIDSSSTKPVTTTIGSTRRPSATVETVLGSRSLFGELRRLSTVTSVTPRSTESSVTAKTSNSGSSIFSRLAKSQATTTKAVPNTGATTRSTNTRTSSTTSPSKASITTSGSVTTTGVLTNLLGRFNIITRTNKEPEDLKTTATAPPLAPTAKVSNLFGRLQSSVLNQPTITTTTQSSREVGIGRRREKDKVAGLSESNKNLGILPVMVPSEEMMDKVVDFMENLIFAGSVPASIKQSESRKDSSSSISSLSSARQPDNEEVSLVQGKYSIFGNRREKNSEGDEAGKAGKVGGGVDAVAEKEKDEEVAGDEKVGFGEVKLSRKIGNLLVSHNLMGRKQVKKISRTSENMSDDKLDEVKPDGETSDEIMDIVLESMEKLLLDQTQAGVLDSRPSPSIPTRSTTSSSDPNSPIKPNSSFFSRNALKTRLRPLVAAALSSPQSSTRLEDKVSMLRAVLSEELPPHIRDYILSRQFTQHARTLFRHQQTLSVPAVQVTQSSASTSQVTTARSTANQETMTLTPATTTAEATSVTEATTTAEATVTFQAASHLKTTIVPTRRVQTVPVQISKQQSLDEKLHDVVSPPRRIIKLFSSTTPVTTVDGPRSSVRVPAATKPGSGQSLSVNSTEPLPRRIVLLGAESDEQPATEDGRKTTTQPSSKQKAVKLLQLVTTTKQPATEDSRKTTTQPSSKQKAVKLLQLVTTTKQPGTTSENTVTTNLPTRRVVQAKLVSTPPKQTVTTPATEMSSTLNELFSTSNDVEATLSPLDESQSRRIVLIKSLASSILPELNNAVSSTIISTTKAEVTSVLTTTTTVTTTTVLPTASLTSKPRSRPVESLPRRIVLLKGLSDLVKSDRLVSNNLAEKNSNESPTVSGGNALHKLVSLANAQSSEPSVSLLGQTTSSFSNVAEGNSRTPLVDVSPTVSDTNPKTGKSLSRRIVLLKALSEDLITSKEEGIEYIIKKELKALRKPASISEKVSSKSIPEEEPSTNTPRRPIKPTPPVLPRGGNALPKLVSLANVQSSESSALLLSQTTSSFSKVAEGNSRTPLVDDTNPRTGKSLSRRIVLLKALSEDLITSKEEGIKHIIKKELKALHKPASISEKVSSKSIPEDEPSTNTPRRPIKPTPPVLPNLMPKAFNIHPAVSHPSPPSLATTKQATILSQKPSPPTTTSPPISTLVTYKSTVRRILVSETIIPTRIPVIKTTIPLRTSPTPLRTSPTPLRTSPTPTPKSQPVELSTPTVGVKSIGDPTQSLATRLPPQVATPRKLSSGESAGQEVLKTVLESSSPAKEVIQIEVDFSGVETKAKASSPIEGKIFFSRTPYREVASFHSLGEGGVELVTLGGRTLARSSSGGSIPVRDSLPAGLTRTLKVTPVFITGVGRGRFF